MDVKTLRLLLANMPDDAAVTVTGDEGMEASIRYLGHEPDSVEVNDKSGALVARGGIVWVHTNGD